MGIGDAEVDETSAKVRCDEDIRDLREPILKPFSNKMIPKGEPTAKKFWTWKFKGGAVGLLSACGIELVLLLPCCARSNG